MNNGHKLAIICLLGSVISAFSISNAIALTKKNASSLTLSITTTPLPITVYFAGISGWNNIQSVQIKIGDDSFRTASSTTGSETSNGQYKVTYTTQNNADTLNSYFVENTNKYRHPNCPSNQWNTDYSTIDISSVGTLRPGHSYVITWTSWHNNYDNWEHAWFNYTFAEL